MLPLEKQEIYRRRYAADRPGWLPATQRYLDRVAARMQPGLRALDLGCGRGGIVEQLDLCTLQITGLDPDLGALRVHRLPVFPRVCGYVEQLPWPDRAFDLICCSWVLEHLACPGPSLREVSRILVPGGHFVFVTPNARHPLLLLNRLLGWTRGELVERLYRRASRDTFPAFYRANTPRRLAALCRDAGLELLALDTVDDPTYISFNEPLYRLACLLERLTPAGFRVHLVGEARKRPLSS